jgi:predicted CoA-substrate-specific enzyme activase
MVQSALGIDVGSVSLGIALIRNGAVVQTDYRKHNNSIVETLSEFLERYPLSEVETLAITGRDREEVRKAVAGKSAVFIDPIICFVEGTKHSSPTIRNIIFVGGESFGLIELDAKGAYRRHYINTDCASGTGSFIDQQAERINLTSEQLAEVAAGFTGATPRIATRCAVFAKSDIIHSQQEGFSVGSIACGLCEGLAKSIVDTISSGRRLEGEVAIVGGVSKNVQVVRTMERLLGTEVFRPEHAEVVGAIGAALLAPAFVRETIGPAPSASQEVSAAHDNRPPLALVHSRYPDFTSVESYDAHDTEVAIYVPLENHAKHRVVFGIDIGSTSTKATLVDGEKRVLASFYTRTSGDPIAAVKRIFRCIIDIIKGRDVEFDVQAVGTTGSGRKLIKKLIRADYEVNEITAHARAAVFLDPDVDTIIEIGGQDSKFTQIKNGVVFNSSMNYVCAAGTGSFIEEQAKKLNVAIEDYADLAMGVEAPYTSDRCTVYMERDLNLMLSKGWNKRQILAAVLYSVRDNYINKVINRAFVGKHVYFQGATARNRALVAAFEGWLGGPIHVSPYCHLTGALGVCLLLLEQDIQKTDFVHWDYADVETRTEQEMCQLCNNFCKLTVVKSPDQHVAYGMMCGKDYADKSPRKKEKHFFDSFKVHAEHFRADAPRTFTHAEKIGLPHCLSGFEYQSLWKDFCYRLGFDVVESRASRALLEQGRAFLTAEYCAPIVMGHGHMKELLEKKADVIFFPALIQERHPAHDDPSIPLGKFDDCSFCYYTGYLPDIFKTLPAFDLGDKIVSPVVHFNEGPAAVAKSLFESFKERLPVTEAEVCAAFEAAYARFLEQKKKMLEFGKAEVEATVGRDEIAMVLLGRPYNLLDPVINVHIPSKIVDMGYKVLTQDMIPTSGLSFEHTRRYLEELQWKYAQDIMRATEAVIQNDHLFPIYLTNFRCGPDAFVVEYFKEVMNRCGKPYLIIQLDAYGSDVGYITRIEAGIEAFKNWRQKKQPVRPPEPYPRAKQLTKARTVLIPHVGEIASRFVATAFRAHGYHAFVMEENESTLNQGFRQTSGGECLPITAVIGGVIHAVEKHHLDPGKTALYLPTACIRCNFTQYPILAETITQKLGWANLQVYSPNMFAPMPDVPASVDAAIWECHIIGGLLRKLYAKIKPYEVRRGETDGVLQQAIEMIETSLLKRETLKRTFTKAFELFRSIETVHTQKPKIILLGDLYTKYNDFLNQDVARLVEELGGELLTTSTTEYTIHVVALKAHMLRKLGLFSWKRWRAAWRYLSLKRTEEAYEKICDPLLADQREPSTAEMFQALKKYGIESTVDGETPLTISRAIIFLDKGQGDAILHLNPIFCCPGAVSTSILERIQRDYNVPIINIFYDGSGDHNKALIPHLHFLKEKMKAAHAQR